MGSDRLLPLGFVIVFSLNEYVGWNHRMLGSYRAVLGHFEQDQWFMVASAATNLILSFALFPAFGITGIVAATVVAHCIMWVGRGIVVCRQYMRGSGWRYLRVQAVHLVTLVVLMAGSYRVRPVVRRYSGAAGAGCCGLHPAQPAEPCVLYLDQRCRLSAHSGWPPLAKNYPSLRGNTTWQTIGMLYICTGKYTVFWPEFYETFSRNFYPAAKEYFVFTDAPSIAHEDDPAVHRIDQPAYDWPLSTMKRFAIFLTQKKGVGTAGLSLLFNANLTCREVITPEEFCPVRSRGTVAAGPAAGVLEQKADVLQL